MDHARPERLGELVRTLLPLAPELEVHTEAQQLAEVRPGSTLVLAPRAEDADWLNINRPLFASRALRVVLFCTREVTVALSRGAVDFLDWVSLRLECPAGPVPFAVAGLRCALAARVPGIVWTGGDLEASFTAAGPAGYFGGSARRSRMRNSSRRRRRAAEETGSHGLRWMGSSGSGGCAGRWRRPGAGHGPSWSNPPCPRRDGGRCIGGWRMWRRHASD